MTSRQELGPGSQASLYLQAEVQGQGPTTHNDPTTVFVAFTVNTTYIVSKHKKNAMFGYLKQNPTAEGHRDLNYFPLFL